MSAGFSGKYKLVPDGWDGKIFGKEMFEFTNDPHDPLTFADDILIRPDNHFRTDMGSVPRTLQFIAPRWFNRFRYPQSYILHDSGYSHHGHWVAANGSDWHFVKMTRKQVDDLLYDMIIAEGGSHANARTIWLGVRLGGRGAWGKAKSV